VTDNLDARAPYADQRKNHIIDRLRSSGRIDAVHIAESLGVTGETIRKDLISLERQGHRGRCSSTPDPRRPNWSRSFPATAT
jgi:predicted ArsR family transcriptional regulator